MSSEHNLACSLVVAYEKKEHRTTAIDVSKKHIGYDIQGPRNIEVKATSHSKPPSTFYFHERYWEQFKKDPNAWIYIVFDIKKKPKLITISRDDLLKSEKPYLEILVNVHENVKKAAPILLEPEF